MKFAILAVAIGLGAALPGCIVTSDDHPEPVLTTGTLVVDWTIDGRKDESLCELADAARVRIGVTASSDGSIADYSQDCAVFATSIELWPGDYTADVVLLDPGGAERTTPVRLRPFSILGRDQLVIPVDFPSNSFY